MRAQGQCPLFLFCRVVGDRLHARVEITQNAYNACIFLNLRYINHIGVLDVLLTETMLVTTENPGLLPSRSQILQIRAESGILTGRKTLRGVSQE